MDYRIIDTHAHIFPQKIQEKAVDAIGDFYGIPMKHTGEGTSEGLLVSGGRVGVEKYLVCSTATVPRQVTAINDFVAGECAKHPEFIGFGTLHPAMEELEAELDRCQSLGFRGIKLHPDFQQFNIDSPEAMPMYREIARRGMFLLIHLGDETRVYTKPERMRRVMDEVPSLKVFGAHFGGYHAWDEAYEAYEPGTLWMDISSSLFLMDRALTYKFFDKFGIESFFFGSDFPMWDHREELARFLALGLSEEQNRLILAENFLRVYGEK